MKRWASTGMALLLLLSCACNNSKSNAAAASSNQIPSQASNSPALQIAKATGLPLPPSALSLNEATPKSIDSIYKDAINVDTTKAVFEGRTHEFFNAYKQMLGDFIHYLQTNESFKNKSFSFFNRVYFEPDGTIDYYFYSLKPGELTQDEEALFKKSLNEFIKTYKFPMTAKVPFAQCSPVIVEPADM